jgi:UDP-N-acetylmuramoylalanine--D-glutamate ligase
MDRASLQDSRVTLLGLGRFGGGVAAAKYLVRSGARLTILDQARPDSLNEALRSIASLPLEAIRLGKEAAVERFQADLLVVNPAVPWNHPLVLEARRRNIPVTTEVALFLADCPAEVIGVTGSNGKSSTTSMIGHLLAPALAEQGGHGRVHVGGNIGGSLLDVLSEIQPHDWIVLELSSFQLHYFDSGIPRPRIVVMTNFVPNHLNWHGSMDHYAESKRKIFSHHERAQLLIYHQEAPGLSRWSFPEHLRRIEPVSAEASKGLERYGKHQVENGRLAVTAARTAARWPNCHRGFPSDLEGSSVLSSFPKRLYDWSPPPMRLQPIGQIRGCPLYNDSASTTPESSIAAMTTLSGGWFLIGGMDKGANYDPLLRVLKRQAKGVAFFGQIGRRFRDRLRTSFPHFPMIYREKFPDALPWIFEKAEPPDPIVFSPACAGLDQFQNYRERGMAFERAVATWKALF